MYVLVAEAALGAAAVYCEQALRRSGSVGLIRQLCAAGSVMIFYTGALAVSWLVFEVGILRRHRPSRSWHLTHPIQISTLVKHHSNFKFANDPRGREECRDKEDFLLSSTIGRLDQTNIQPVKSFQLESGTLYIIVDSAGRLLYNS